MSEKGKLQNVDEEATRLRASYQQLQDGVGSHDRVTRAYHEGRMHGGKLALESHVSMRNGLALMASDKAQQSKDHYEQNAAAYHDLAIKQATEAGVEIEVQQSQPSAEPIEVHIEK